MTSGRTTFIDAVVDGFQGWRDYSGRASRSQFWYWTLFTVLVNMVLSTLDSLLFPAPVLDVPVTPELFTSSDFTALLDATVSQLVVSIAAWAEYILLVPTIAVTARRFRDGGLPAALGTMCRLIPYVTTPLILAVGYSVVGQIDNPSMDGFGPLAIATLAFFVFGLASLGSLVMLLIGGLRPSRVSAGS